VAGMADRSSRPHHSPSKTPQPVVRKIVHLGRKQRLGPIQIAGRLGCRHRPCTPSSPGAGSTGCPISTTPPGSRSGVTNTTTGRDAARRHQKLGNIPDGGGWRYLGRVQGERNRQATTRRAGGRNTRYELRIGTAFVHTRHR
jgi:hypothetical protein